MNHRRWTWALGAIVSLAAAVAWAQSAFRQYPPLEGAESSTLKRLFPDRPVVELPSDHSIFHAVYDLTH